MKVQLFLVVASIVSQNAFADSCYQALGKYAKASTGSTADVIQSASTTQQACLAGAKNVANGQNVEGMFKALEKNCTDAWTATQQRAGGGSLYSVAAAGCAVDAAVDRFGPYAPTQFA